jgi:hypothetical protein
LSFFPSPFFTFSFFTFAFCPLPSAFYICTQSRGRTGTTLLSLVFETSASTNSAIWAFGQRRKDKKNKRVANFSLELPTLKKSWQLLP